MELNDILGPLICGVVGGIAGTDLLLKLKKKDRE